MIVTYRIHCIAVFTCPRFWQRTNVLQWRMPYIILRSSVYNLLTTQTCHPAIIRIKQPTLQTHTTSHSDLPVPNPATHPSLHI